MSPEVLRARLARLEAGKPLTAHTPDGSEVCAYRILTRRGPEWVLDTPSGRQRKRTPRALLVAFEALTERGAA